MIWGILHSTLCTKYGVPPSWGVHCACPCACGCAPHTAGTHALASIAEGGALEGILFKYLLISTAAASPETVRAVVVRFGSCGRAGLSTTAYTRASAPASSHTLH